MTDDQLPAINKEEIDKLRQGRENDYKEFTEKINHVERSLTDSLTNRFTELKDILASNRTCLFSKIESEVAKVEEKSASKSDFHRVHEVQQEHGDRLHKLETDTNLFLVNKAGGKQTIHRTTGWPAVFMNPYFLIVLFTVSIIGLIMLVILTRNPLTLDQIIKAIEASKTN